MAKKTAKPSKGAKKAAKKAASKKGAKKPAEKKGLKLGPRYKTWKRNSPVDKGLVALAKKEKEVKPEDSHLEMNAKLPHKQHPEFIRAGFEEAGLKVGDEQ